VLLIGYTDYRSPSRQLLHWSKQFSVF